MSGLANRSLQERRDSLLRQLELGRELINQKLQEDKRARNLGPRSMTMRLLKSHPALAGGLLVALGAVLKGTRWAKSMSIAASVLRLTRTAMRRSDQ
jgi:hypothetical protein